MLMHAARHRRHPTHRSRALPHEPASVCVDAGALAPDPATAPPNSPSPTSSASSSTTPNDAADAGAPPNKVKTWDNKLRAWSDCFGKDPTTACPSFQPMRGYYEARNAIMHRRGELTDAQRKDAVYERLSAGGITLIGFNVVLDLTTLRACVYTCVTCIEQLDATR